MISTQDGEIEPTSNTVVARAAGPPVFEFNLGFQPVWKSKVHGTFDLHAIDATPDFHTGECAYDDAGIDGVLQKMAADYNENEYDFFFRNCNHFADDLGRRLSDGNEVDRKFMVREATDRSTRRRDPLLRHLVGWKIGSRA